MSELKREDSRIPRILRIIKKTIRKSDSAAQIRLISLERADIDGEFANGREEKVDIPGGSGREERNADGVIEQQRGAGDQSPDVAQPPRCVVLPSPRHRVGGGKFGIGEADQDINKTGGGESKRRRPMGGAHHQAERHINVGADIGVAPGE
ncbi:MAG: hypothetical protein MPW15_25070 [Candidatus Manganitrophus sp.]|nr:hypothetical protein [Candidatus Manganitrophus sp.]